MKTRLVPLTLAAGLLAGCLNRVAWMPDGHRLVYVSEGAVWLATLEGTRTKLGDTAGIQDPEVAPAPRGGLIAVAGKSGASGRVILFDEAGTVRWTGEAPGDEARFMPGSWSPDGTRLLVWTGGKCLLVEAGAAGITAKPVETGEAARLDESGSLVSLKVGERGATLERVPPAGGRGSPAAWKLPAGIAEPAPLMLDPAAKTAWWRGKRGGQEVTVLAGADGRISFSSTRTLVAAGPDPRSYVTDDGGYAITGPDRPAVNLNAAYNAILRMDLNWQLADPAAAAEKYDPAALLRSAPAFSPDGTRAAILTPRMLCLVTLRTGDVVAIAKW